MLVSVTFLVYKRLGTSEVPDQLSQTWLELALMDIMSRNLSRASLVRFVDVKKFYWRQRNNQQDI